jgi:adenylate cyclase
MDALAAADIFLFEGFRLDRRGGVLFRRDQQGVFAPIAIGRRALDILGVLVERPGDLISRDDIIEAVWPGRTVEDSNLNVQVAALRRILDDRRTDGSCCIQTVSGRGYRFVGAVTRVEPATPQSGTSGGGTIAEDGQPHGPSAGAAAPTPAAPRMSIVVLPFTNMSDDRDQQYFADGITEDLTTDLSRIEGSFVISRNTAFTYREKPLGARQIGRQLGVRYVLEGSVRRSGEQVRVNAQLIDTETDAHLWAERFESDTGELFALQDQIARRTAVALNLEMVAAEAARPAEHSDVLDCILRGRAAKAKPPSAESYAEAISQFERALTFDPRSVEAQSWLADALVCRMLDFRSSAAESDLGRAEQLAARAVAASPRSAAAHYAKGQVLRVQGRYREAIGEYESVLALNRNWVSASAAIGRCKIFLGVLEEAILAQQEAIRLSPRDPYIGIWYFRIGQACLLQSRIDHAVAWLEKARAANPSPPFVHLYLAAACALNGDTGRAAAELAEARRLSGSGFYPSIARLRALAHFGAPATQALFEVTFFEGLRKAGMPEE